VARAEDSVAFRTGSCQLRAEFSAGPEGVVEPGEDVAVGERPVEELAVIPRPLCVGEGEELLRPSELLEQCRGTTGERMASACVRAAVTTGATTVSQSGRIGRPRRTSGSP
jgi:hypothetical protein